jgi:hypothetical protein
MCIVELVFELGPDQYSELIGNAYFLPDFFYRQSVALVIIGGMLIAQSGFLLPMGALVFVHVGNLWHGKTTSERFGHS